MKQDDIHTRPAIMIAAHHSHPLCICKRGLTLDFMASPEWDADINGEAEGDLDGSPEADSDGDGD